MTSSDDIKKQEQRAQAASLMLPWNALSELYAAQAGVSVSEIADASDDFILGLLQDSGFSRIEMIATVPELQSMSREDQHKLLDLFNLEGWMAENIRRGAREEDPLPAGLLVGGVWIDESRGKDWPAVWAVATSASDPDAMARTFLRKCRAAFGKQAFRDVSQNTSHGRTHAFTPEEMCAMHERGMSYRDIAIQTLRDEHPGIIENPDSFKTEIKRERARIIKVIRAAQELWSARMPDDSIG